MNKEKLDNYKILSNDLVSLTKKEKFENDQTPWNQFDTNYRLTMLVDSLIEIVDNQQKEIEKLMVK